MMLIIFNLNHIAVGNLNTFHETHVWYHSGSNHYYGLSPCHYTYINIYIGPAGSDENFLNYFKYDAALPSMDGLELQSITLGLSL
jgi:hypothetical protein